MIPDAKLAESARQTMEVIVEKAEPLAASIRRCEKELTELMAGWQSLRESYNDLATVYNRYKAADSEHPRAMPTPNLPGPTEWVETYLGEAKAAGELITRQRLTESLQSAIAAGRVASSTTDPAKLASTLIGSLFKRGRLMEYGYTSGTINVGHDGAGRHVELSTGEGERPSLRGIGRIVRRST